MQIGDRNPLPQTAFAPSPSRKTGEAPVSGDSVQLSGKSLNNTDKIGETLEQSLESLYSGAEKTSEYLDKSPVVKATVDSTLQFLKTIKTFPNFIYPSLIGMTAEERALVIAQLDKLPLSDVGTVKSITMLDSMANASGGAGPVPSSPFILLTRDNFTNSGEWGRMVLTHEMGHAVDYDTGLFGLPKLFSESSKSPWGKGPYITDYAETGPGWYPSEWDDFAESYSYYHVKPEELKAACPEKYERIAKMEENNFFESLVDRKEFRETGKLMSRILEQAPYLQNGLAMITLVAGAAQAFKALGEMKRAEKTGDEKLEMNATLNFAAGSCFASKIFAVPGMALEGARSELNRAIERKEITATQANAVVQSTIGVIAGPLGSALNWVMSRLPWNRSYEINDTSIENLYMEIPSEKLAILKGLRGRDFSSREMNRLLEGLDFSDGEIDKVRRSMQKSEKPAKGTFTYSISDSTIENLKGHMAEEKLEIMRCLKGEEYPAKTIEKLLKNSDFNKTDITLAKAYMIETEIKLEPADDSAKGSLKKAALIGAGGAAGAVGGGFIGPYLGVLGGFAVAGPVGAVIGLIGGAIIGLQVGARIGGRLGNAIGKGIENLTGSQA